MRHKRHLLLLLLLLLAVPCFAQHKAKFHIVSFAENPHDMSPKNHEKLDPDGHPYAIIKVTSNNPDDNLGAYSFDFEHIPHIVEVKDGELWVYVGRNAMFVNISREGYHSIKRYDLGLTIRPGRAYEMQLSVEAPNVFRQMLEFNVQPSGVKATVMIKSSKAGSQLQLLGETDVDGAVAKSLELGVYTYTVLADKYHNSEGRIVLDKRNGHHIEKVTLRPNFSRITFKADAGTDIYINEEKVGHEIWNGEMEAGVYSVECRKPKHKSVVETIKIEENNDRVIELRKPIPQTGVLAVTSDPLGAMIKVDGKDCGITPKNIVDLLIGSHKVEISKNGYLKEVREVEILENETVECEAQLVEGIQNTMNTKGNPKEVIRYDKNGDLLQYKTKRVHGLVVNQHGYPIVGAEVIATSGDIKTMVEANGTFSLEIPETVESVIVRQKGYFDLKKRISDDKMICRMQRGQWFVNAIGYIPFVYQESEYSPLVGLMVGRIANWGWYAKVAIQPSSKTEGPIPLTITAGVTKKILPSLYVYAGAGWCRLDFDYEYYDSTEGLALDLGFMIRLARKFNVNIGASSANIQDEFQLGVHLGLGYNF